MLEAFRPVSLIVGTWPTDDFHLPEPLSDFGKQMVERFAWFERVKELKVAGLVGPANQLNLGLDVPRLILEGSRQSWQLEVAPQKMNFRRLVREPTRTVELFEQVVECLLPMQAWLAENYNLRVYRIGALLHLFCNMRSSANERMAAHLLQSAAMQGRPAHAIHLSVLSRLSLEGGQAVNRWTRIQPLRSRDARHVDFAAKIEIDINTLPENTQTKTSREIRQFLEDVAVHIDRDMPLLQDETFIG